MDIHGFAFVAGGGSGIGRATALAFISHGAQGVMIGDIDLQAAQRVVDECKSISTNQNMCAEAVHMDITDEESVQLGLDKASKLFGRIDYCVNSAGVGLNHTREIADADTSEFTRMYNVNVLGTLYLTRAISAIMRSQEPKPTMEGFPKRGVTRGNIVNLGSASSFAAVPQCVQYTTSKHAVLGLTKNAALDNVAHNIRVNSVCPSWADTPMVQRDIDRTPELKQFIESVVPMRRMATPEEVADVVIFMCSPRSSYITGGSLLVDGGTTLSVRV